MQRTWGHNLDSDLSHCTQVTDFQDHMGFLATGMAHPTCKAVGLWAESAQHEGAMQKWTPFLLQAVSFDVAWWVVVVFPVRESDGWLCPFLGLQYGAIPLLAPA